MKKLLILVALSLAARDAVACPMCNIFNYLYSNLQAAPNIVVATVKDQADKRHALLRIDRVLRGSHQPGEVVKWEMWEAAEEKGKQFIFNDTQSSGATFEILPMELEWEVAFLIRDIPYDKEQSGGMPVNGMGMPGMSPEETPGDGVPGKDAHEGTEEARFEQALGKRRPTVRDAEEAVRATQGVSTVTRYLGIQYVKKHSAECIPLLAKAITVRRQEFAGKHDSPLAERATDGLVEALWLSGDDRAVRWLSRHVDSFLAKSDANLGLDKSDWQSTDPETEHLASVLEWSKQRPASQATLRESLSKSLPNCRGRVLAAVVYAAHKSEILTPEQVEQGASLAARVSPTAGDAVALGFYRVGCHYRGSWSIPKALGAFQFARTHCHNVQLQHEIGQGIKDCKEWPAK